MRPSLVDVCTARAREKQSSITIYRNGPPICTGLFLGDRLVGGANLAWARSPFPRGKREARELSLHCTSGSSAEAGELMSIPAVSARQCKKVNAVPLGLSL